jgi:hypothetical protein
MGGLTARNQPSVDAPGQRIPRRTSGAAAPAAAAACAQHRHWPWRCGLNHPAPAGPLPDEVLLVAGEPGPVRVGLLTHQLAALGVTAPTGDQIGYELNDQGWQAEIAWETPRIAIIADGDDECVAAFAAANWDARVAGDWPPEELAARILGGNR